MNKDKHRIIISRMSTNRPWEVITNPMSSSTAKWDNMVLMNGANDYTERKNCGVIYRMIRFQDRKKYGIKNIPETAIVNPEELI